MDIEAIREYCLGLPEATEDIKWESDLCFCIRDKMFCVVGLNDDPLQMTVKVTPQEFDDLIERPEYAPAKYVGRYKWVTLSNTSLVDAAELKSLIEGSFYLIRDKKKKT